MRVRLNLAHLCGHRHSSRNHLLVVLRFASAVESTYESTRHKQQQGAHASTYNSDNEHLALTIGAIVR